MKGRLLIEPADQPAPKMRALLHSLANPCPYGGNTDPEYRAAVDAINAAFGKRVEADLRFTIEMQRKDAA